MQQILQMLKTASEAAKQKGFAATQQQLELWHAQLDAFASTQPRMIPLMLQLLSKAIAGIQAKLDDKSSNAPTDAALCAEGQAQAVTLFQSLNLVQEYVIQRRNLQQSNENARKNQKYYDAQKNQAVTQFNTYLAQLLAKNILTNAELMAFNNRLRETLVKDFGVQNLAQPQAQTTSQPQPQPTRGTSKVANNVMSGISNIFNAANSKDPEAMKGAAQNFIGFLISMVVECIASVCRIFAPAMSPFISQMANFAKGAFSNWFATSIDTAMKKEAQKPATSAAPTAGASAMPKQTASTTAQTAATTGFGRGIFNAMQNFMSRNVGIPAASIPTPAAPKASPKI